MNRRQFIQHASMLSAAAGLFSNNAFATSGTIDKIGVQLWSLPKMLESDFSKAIEALSVMGYKEVEMYGPYPFSTSAAQKRFQDIVPMLGFSGSGYFGYSADEIKQIFSRYGMTVPSIHTDLDTLQSNMEGLAKASSVLGFEYVCLPSIPEEKRKTIDDYKTMADEFNKLGESAKKHNLKFTYHNHGYGIKEVNGKIPLQILLDHTDPSLVFLEMDVYWTTAGGADPVTYLEKYPNRYHLMHVKDMKEKKVFSGDGGNPQQWIELFPHMTTAGSGVIDLKNIIKKATQTGVKHFFVEQDMVANPEIALKQSADYLKSI